MDQSSGDWHLWSVSLELPWPLCWAGCLKTRAGSPAASPSPTSLPCCASHRGFVLLVVTVGSPVPPSSLCPGCSEPLQGCDGHGLPLLSVPGPCPLLVVREPRVEPPASHSKCPRLFYLWWCIYFHATLSVRLPLSLSHCVFKSVLYTCGEEISLMLLVFLIFLILC